MHILSLLCIEALRLFWEPRSKHRLDAAGIVSVNQRHHSMQSSLIMPSISSLSATTPQVDQYCTRLIMQATHEQLVCDNASGRSALLTFGRQLLHDIVHAKVHVVEAEAPLPDIQRTEDRKQSFPDVVDVEDHATRLYALVDTVAVDPLKHHACITGHVRMPRSRTACPFAHSPELAARLQSTCKHTFHRTRDGPSGFLVAERYETPAAVPQCIAAMASNG